ncbi:MAG: hypothetical protein KBF58_12710 [Methyloversatilis sp.]|jgi:hypothetical protein|nr:hypothetical protein [Methyloversatilis sp.]MBP6193754.1 hypothetical protein [Methyloversatilis sp.]MBP9118923.1 hypothetical protein [Methyloversatilis sp.]
MNREHLASWSLELTDDEFPEALAALGALAALAPARLSSAFGADGWQPGLLAALLDDAVSPDSGIVHWTLPPAAPHGAPPRLRIVPAGAARPIAEPAPEADVLVEVWREFLAGLQRRDQGWRLRLRLAVRLKSGTAAGSMALASLLAQPQVRAAGIYIDEVFASDGRTDWCWPFTIATLPDDPLTAPLAALQLAFPPVWPFRFISAGRDHPRVEVLVIGAAAQNALTRVLESRLRLRCSLVIVAGLGSDSPRTAEPLLRALVAKLEAEGVAVLEAGTSPQDFAERLKHFAYELTHNKTLDVALTEAFRPGLLLLLNRDLLSVSHLDTSVGNMAQRLRELPPDTEVRLSERAFRHLGLPPKNMRPALPRMRSRSAPPEPSGAAAPSDLADAIDTGRAQYRFDSEAMEASAVSELNRSLHEEESAAERQTAVPRFIHQRSLRRQAGEFIEETSGYVVGQPIMLFIHIGPKREGSIASKTAFPEEKLPKNRASHRLQVMFHEPQQFDQPLLDEMLLPRKGASSAAKFVFTPKFAGPFEGRISVVHRGRVLQTVMLRTQVSAQPGDKTPDGGAPGISLDDETQVRHDWSDLGRRRQFDLAIVTNHTGTGASTLTGLAGEKAWATDLEGIREPLLDINAELSKVAYSTDDYGDGLDQGENPALLVELARIGADLYSQLYVDQFGRLATEGFDIGRDSVTHIQIVSARADAVLPLEFLYDFEPPDPGAKVCPQHREALEKGRCPARCARTDAPREHVCPMGFWGLKKVIERHIFDPQAAAAERAAGADGAEVVVRAVEALDGRDRLDLSAGALVAHSAEVSPDAVSALVGMLGERLGSPVPVVKDWADWLLTVRNKRPALLVAFPHNEGRKRNIQLEIGGKKLFTLRLPTDYVRPADGPPPLVFLLGCDVAGTAEEFSDHIRNFRQAGAAVVVSTIATVFGTHAVRVGEAIVNGLLKTGTPGEPAADTRIGEVMRDARRAALLDSVPMALCVVAFGDADWRI